MYALVGHTAWPSLIHHCLYRKRCATRSPRALALCLTRCQTMTAHKIREHRDLGVGFTLGPVVFEIQGCQKLEMCSIAIHAITLKFYPEFDVSRWPKVKSDLAFWVPYMISYLCSRASSVRSKSIPLWNKIVEIWVTLLSLRSVKVKPNTAVGLTHDFLF